MPTLTRRHLLAGAAATVACAAMPATGQQEDSLHLDGCSQNKCGLPDRSMTM